MFGNNDNQQQPTDPVVQPAALNAAMPDPISATPPAGFNIPAHADNQAAQPGASTDPTVSAPELPGNAPFSPVSTDDNSDVSDPVASSGSDDLVDIKQQALQHLSPLVSHLDQTPEEKFRTTMMMIQASDNKDLIKDAFEAAQQITDDKARAQALLDVINEINYFTQHDSEA